MINLGEHVDKLHALREEKRALENALKEKEREMAEVETNLMAMMTQAGVDKVSSSKATVSISESTKPSVENWDEFVEYIYENRYIHLMDKRASVTGCRELFDKYGRIPGVVPYVQRKLRMLTKGDV